MKNSIQKLGDILASRMVKTAEGAVPTTIELGTIGTNLSLTTDSLKATIPRGDYMVNLALASKTYRTSEESHTHSGGEHEQKEYDGAHTHEDGEHDHRLPEAFRGLAVGDRVLVAWCGFEPVVIAVLVSS